ncbi:MAG: multiheme c-type cytochrome [Chitinophagaceae bacterium]
MGKQGKKIRADENEKTGSPAYERKVNFSQFAGSSACAGCHKDIYKKHLQTGHFLSSQPALEKYIRGSFEKGKNKFSYSPVSEIVMEKRDSGLFQVLYQNGEEKRAMHFDIVTGSGAKGQSFLYWRKNSLFQMPVTFYTAAGQWANSPGFPNKVVMNRLITSRCLECHTTFTETISPPGKEPEEFDHDRIIFGVDCEKCHGPAAEHVNFQTANPTEKKGKNIINPATLSRQQNLDLCALCHGGALSKIKPSFEFTVGDALSDFFVLKDLKGATPNFDNVDVHGNQFGLLSASKCFTGSNMTCSSCHNSHENERGNTKLFSQRCINCHNASHEKICKMTATMGPSIKNNCIDCHMPASTSKAITLRLPGREVPVAARVRTHLISIYPDEVRKFVSEKNKR